MKKADFSSTRASKIVQLGGEKKNIEPPGISRGVSAVVRCVTHCNCSLYSNLHDCSSAGAQYRTLYHSAATASGPRRSLPWRGTFPYRQIAG